MSNEKIRLSRRRFLDRTARGSIALAGLGLAAGSRAAQDKIPQSTVAYQDHPKNGQKCSACMYWQGGNRCSKVAGKISPQGWCVLFVPA